MEPLPLLSVDLIARLDRDEGPLRIDHNTPLALIYGRAARRELIDSLKFAVAADDISEPVLKRKE